MAAVDIFFDLSGVVFTNGSQTLTQIMSDTLGMEPGGLARIISGPASWALRRGELSATDFWKQVEPELSALGVPSALDFRTRWLEAFVPQPGMLPLLATLAARYRLGVISETVEERVAYLDERYGFRQYFAVELYSYEQHADKRDGLLFEKALPHLRKGPSPSIMVEDDPASARIATGLGMQALLFSGTPALVRELARLGLSLNGDP